MTEDVNFRLRPMAPEDKPLILTWRNSERVRKNMYTDHLISQDEHDRWFESALRNASACFLVFELRSRPVGLISFTHIVTTHQRCTWAFYLGETDVQPGTGSVMEFMALDHAFGPLQIRKLCCEVLAFNVGVMRLHERFGFTQEGCLREHHLKGERYEDVVVLARFGATWPADRERLRPVVFRDYREKKA